MSLEKIADKVIDTDVLVIGGGLAGCCAAIKAKEHGLNVILLEKANVERSGSAGEGIDHYEGFFPRDGTSVLKLIKQEEMRVGKYGGYFANVNTKYKIYSNTFWAFDELEKLGVTMRWYDGEPLWMPFPKFDVEFGGERITLRVQWQNVKPELAAALKKRKVNVLNRTMAIDLLTNNGAVIGATAVNIRTGEFIVIKSKATVVGTGRCNRLHNPETPQPGKYKMCYHFCPASISGDGYAITYRAGGEIVNMDVIAWLFRIRDDKMNSYGNFTVNEGIPMKVYTWKGDEILAPTPRRYLELDLKGQTPLYLSLEDLPDDFHKRIEMAFIDERMVSFKLAEDRGCNPRTHRYELQAIKPNGFMRTSGAYVDEDFKSSVAGLYIIGDSSAGCGGVTAATTSGLLVGENISTFVKEAREPVVDEGQVESQKQTALAPLGVNDGVEPMEFEMGIRYISEYYSGLFGSEGKLLEGQRRLGSLRRVWLPKLMARNPHHLMRCLEVRNVMEIAELRFQACLERKETRGNYIRFDYQERNPSLDDKIISQRMEKGKPIIEWMKRVGLKLEYEKGRE